MMKQRITYISLVLFAVLFLAPQEQLSASSYYVERNSWEWIFDHIIREGDDSFYGGDGSKERPYRIWQGQHLAKLAYDVRADVLRFRKDLEPYLCDEIVRRYYYQRGGVQQQLIGDPCIDKALEVLSSSDEYNIILGKK